MPVIRPERLTELRSGRARYAPLKRVAIGGMGEVWRGEAWFNDGHVEPVAFKRMRPDVARQQSYRRMFAEEARLGLMLEHPNLVQLYDVRHRGELILIMEYVEGRSLKQILDQLHEQDARPSVEVSLYIAREVARALAYAHTARDDQGKPIGLVHGDMSPHNVLIDVHGDVKLMDFGLARATDSIASYDPKKIVGKHAYVAPELVTRREVSQKNDLFSLGIVLWESLTGERLFLGSSPKDTLERVQRGAIPAPSSLNARVSPALDRLLERLLAREPSERYASAAKLLADFEGLMRSFDENALREGAANLARVHPAVLAGELDLFHPAESPIGQDAFEALRADVSSVHEPRRRRRSGTAPRPVLRLSHEELDDFFGGLDTSVYARPPQKLGDAG
jgi:serine/threonine-protein kinase